MVENTIAFTTAEASKGGIGGIKSFQATLVGHERIPNKFGETDDNGKAQPDQIQVSTEDVVILEMEPGEEEPDLADGKYQFVINYAKPGKPTAHKNTFWMKGYVASAEALGTTPKALEGKTVTFEKKAVVLFKKKDKDTGEEEEIVSTNFVFVKDTDQSASTEAKIKDKIKGKNKAAALREVMMDTNAKRDPAIKEAVSAGKPIFGLELIGGVYAEKAT